jgi:general stress protein CsbA
MEQFGIALTMLFSVITLLFFGVILTFISVWRDKKLPFRTTLWLIGINLFYIVLIWLLWYFQIYLIAS